MPYVRVRQGGDRVRVVRQKSPLGHGRDLRNVETPLKLNSGGSVPAGRARALEGSLNAIPCHPLKKRVSEFELGGRRISQKVPLRPHVVISC